jgi:tight adherence protein B
MAGADGDGAAVVVSGVQPSAGRIEFFLAARGLSLEGARVRVSAGGTPLAATVRAGRMDGGPGEPATAARGVVLVIDASGSMAGDRLRAARAAAADYARAAPADVWLGLVTVSDRPATVVDLTTDRGRFTAAVARIPAAGRTALYDGILAGVGLLDPSENPAAERLAQRRVVVLSDGEDTASDVDVDELAERLARADAIVDAVAFGEADRVTLGRLTGVTGGRVVPAGAADALSRIFRDMAAELSAPIVVSATVPPELSGRSTTLRVEVTGDGTTLTDEIPVRLRVDPAAGAGPETFQPGQTDRRPLLVGLGLLVVALLILTFVLAGPARARTEIRRRLDRLDRFPVGRRATVSGPARPGGAMLRAALAVSERTVRRPDRRERIELALDRAGSPLRPAEWMLIRAAAVAGTAVVGALILPWWVAAAVALPVGWLGSGQYLRVRAARRTRAFGDQLPDALRLVVGSLRSGFSLSQAIDAVVREGADPIATELGRALAETRLGGDLEDGLEQAGERTGSRDMAWLVMAIRIQREVGGNLSETLETAVETMRERGRLTRHVRALSAEGRLSALVLLGMPIVLGGWMFLFRRDYLRPLYTEPLGLAMLVGAVLLVLAGAAWLRRLVRVEV